ncbi:MAG TPA: hypothetical protein VFW15_11130 [Thermoanaerobaculia bacterium]|nr:hypothetical protein [Thermoanaerobaculia bacterium]
MSVPVVIEVREESERSWEDAAARAVVALGRQLVKNIDSLNFDHSRQESDRSARNGRYCVEASVSLTRTRLDQRRRIAP